MIVGGGKQQRNKGSKVGSKKKTGKGKGAKSSVIERAKAALKQAIVNGTLNELLWKETSRDVPEGDSEEESDEMPFLDDEDTENESDGEDGPAASTDDVSGWNGLLNRTANKAPTRGSPKTVGGPSSHAEYEKRRKGKRGKEKEACDLVPAPSDYESSGRSEDEESQASPSQVPRIRTYTRIMHKLKSAAARLSVLQCQDEETEGESSSAPEAEEEAELPPQVR
jgi:hypothetical protein